MRQDDRVIVSMAAAIGTSLCSERRMAKRRLVRPITISSERSSEKKVATELAASPLRKEP
jgi:hypothetical protein